ncbi:MAG TPA: hypothetical protein VHH73_01910 [Verrucomicrobiae bacterium]|nr:hypothetical protein [Verrucomicrobiae bacterium]
MTWRAILQIVWLILALATGFLAGFLSQAASPDYHRLFWNSLKFFAGHAVVSAGYFVLHRTGTRWLCLTVTLLALACLGELAVRVWLS